MYNKKRIMKKRVSLLFLSLVLLTVGFFVLKSKSLAAVDPNLVKTVDKTTAEPGEELTYTVSFTNTTGQTINGFVLTDTIPTNTTFVPGSYVGNPQLIGNVLTWPSINVSNGTTLTTSFKVLVGSTEPPPTGDAQAVIYAPTKANVGYKVSFDGSQSLGRNQIGEVDIYGPENYAWDFGDGSPIQSNPYNSMIGHQFSTAGTYNVKLTVTDAAGGVNSTTKSIEITTLPKINVSAFTDDAVQAAVTSLGSNGIVHLPAGTYFFDRQVALRDGIVVEGEGRNNTIIIQPSSAYKAFITAGNNTRVTNLKIRNGDLDSGTNDDLIWPVAMEMSVANRQPYKNIYVDNSEFEHLQQTIKGTYGSSGTNLTGASAFFENNIIHGNDQSGAGYGFSSEMGSYTVARNNEFYTNRHSVEGGGKSGSSTTNYISYKSGYDLVGNTFHGPDSPRGSNSVDVAVDMHMGGRGRLRIANNTFDGIKYGLGLHDGWGEIKGNTFKNMTGYIIKLTKDYHNGYDGTKCVDYLDPNLTGRAVCKGAFHFNLSNNTFTTNTTNSWYVMDYDATHPISNDIFINGCRVTSNTYSGKGNPGDPGLACP